MWINMVCLMLVCRGLAADELLDALAGAAGSNRVSLCMGAEGAAGAAARGGDERAPPMCPGVLWRGIWVLVRASCLEPRPLYKVLVLRDCDGFTCVDLDAGKEVWKTRKLRARVVHPDADADLALLALDRRYWHLEPHPANYSANYLLSQYTPWMEEVYIKHPMDRRRLSYAHNSSLFSSPLRMFMTTILAPSIIFIAIFVYVIFFMGPNDEITYKNMKYEESETSVKCP